MTIDGRMEARKSKSSSWVVCFWVLSCLALGGAFLLSSAPAGAMQLDQWRAPLRLFETSGRASDVEVVTDAAGMVHVFWAYGAPGREEEGDAQAIYYTYWQDGDWAPPLDVLVSPGGRVAHKPSAIVDNDGYMHLVWSGGTALYYSRVYAPLAADVQAWTPPLEIAAGTAVLEPALAADGDGGLYIVWTQEEAGLIFARSGDGGRTWEPQAVIFEAESDTELARWGRIAVDGFGRLHVVLTHALREVGGSEVRSDPNYLYYLRSVDGGETWTEPVLIADEPNFGELNVVTYAENTVHVAWNGRVGRFGRYHRWSDDGGQSWRDQVEILAPAPVDPLGTGGLTGFPAMVVDGTGVLHLVSALGGGNYYFRWANGSWGRPVLISPGLDGFGVTGEQRSLEQPSVAISGGDRLHVAFHDGFERIWYVARDLDAPAVKSEPYATVTPAATATEASPVTEATIVETPTPAFNFERERAEPLGVISLLLLLTVPTALVIMGVMIVVLRRRPYQ